MKTEPIDSFAVGQVYTHDTMRSALSVGNLGGIRPSIDAQGRLRQIAIITSDEDCARSISRNPYADQIENDVLTFTASGREGNQDLSGMNKRLVEQYEVPTPFFGFANTGRQMYRFLGLLQLLRHYPDVQADRKGKLRNVWMFEFRIHSQPTVIRIQQAKDIVDVLFRESSSAIRSADDQQTCPSEIRAQDSLRIESLRSQMLSISPRDFEHLVAKLFAASGFTQVRTTQYQGDGGIDVNAYVAQENAFFAGTHVQAQVKRWRHTVGSIEINSFRGALSTTAKGVFVSTGYFTKAAVQESGIATKPAIALIDGRKLAVLCENNGLLS
jgi:HJR/Mrr/RecB family endonuclease